MPWLRKTCKSMVWLRLEMVTTSMPPMRSTAVGPIEVSTPAFIGPSFLKLPSDSIFTMAFALTGAKADEREVLAGMFTAGPDLVIARPGQTLIGDKNYYGAAFEAAMACEGITLLRPARKGEPARAGAHLFKPLRQIIESVNDTFKGQLDLERHGGHTPGGVMVRILQRILALTAAIWHNDTTGQPVLRSLVSYDH